MPKEEEEVMLSPIGKGAEDMLKNKVQRGIWKIGDIALLQPIQEVLPIQWGGDIWEEPSQQRVIVTKGNPCGGSILEVWSIQWKRTIRVDKAYLLPIDPMVEEEEEGGVQP